MKRTFIPAGVSHFNSILGTKDVDHYGLAASWGGNRALRMKFSQEITKCIQGKHAVEKGAHNE